MKISALKNYLFLLLIFLNSTGFCAEVEYRAFSKLNSVTDMSEYEKKPKLIKTQKGLSTNYRASDFISGISHHYEMKFKDKNTLLSTLDLILTDKENAAKQTEVFR